MDTRLTAIGSTLAAYADDSASRASRATDEILSAATKSSHTVERSHAVAGAGLLSLQREIAAITDANVAALFDHAARLAGARHPDEVLALNHEFVIQRMTVTGEQAAALVRTATDATTRFGAHLKTAL